MPAYVGLKDSGFPETGDSQRKEVVGAGLTDMGPVSHRPQSPGFKRREPCLYLPVHTQQGLLPLVMVQHLLHLFLAKVWVSPKNSQLKLGHYCDSGKKWGL